MRVVSVDGGNIAKIIGAVAALVAAVGGFLVAVGGSDSQQAPAVIVIMGSVLDDGLSDSEADREWLWDESS
jgi:hypothetical protein